MKRFAVVLLAGGLLLGPACDTAEPAPPATLTGTWTGEGTAVDGSTFELVLEMVENNTLLSGEGSVTVPGDTLHFTIQGDYAHPIVTLELLFSDRYPGSISGRVSEDRDRIENASVSGPGFGGQVELVRED